MPTPPPVIIPQSVRDASRNALNANTVSAKPAPYPTPSSNPVDGMLNAGKLTPTERNIYSALPGISTNVGRFITPWASAIDRFTGGWAGKLLSGLDVLAEGLERTAGLADQLYYSARDGKLENLNSVNELKAAWYAGSLLSDTTNLPMLITESGKFIGPNGKETNIEVVKGMRIPNDLPGVNGIVEARKKILGALEKGQDPGEALIKAKDEYYSSLGALTLRAQLYDTYFHVLADPLNTLAPALKPIERLHALRNIGLFKSIGSSSADVLEGAARLSAEAAKLGNVADAARLTDKAAELTKTASKIAEAERVASLAAKAKAAGKYGEAIKLSLQSEKLRKDAGAVTSLQKFAIAATGGDIMQKDSKLTAALRKVPGIGWAVNKASLTPEAKAMELVTTMADYFGVVLGKVDRSNPKWVEETQALMRRISDGSTGLEYGHGVMTIGGRSAQAMAHGSYALAEDVFKAFNNLADDRKLLAAMSSASGLGPTKLLEMAEKDAGALSKMLTAKGMPDMVPEVLKVLAAKLKTVDGKILPYTEDLLTPLLLDAIETHAMRQSVTQFGVQVRGLGTRWAHAMKSAEVLAFMKLNPASAVRNIVGNEMTIVARGLMGVMDDAGVDAFWKTTNILPKRLAEGFSGAMGGEAELVSGASKVLGEALSGGNYGTAERIQKFFGGIANGDISISGWSRAMESSASKRAFTHGYMQFYQKYVPPQILKKIDKAILDRIPKELQELMYHAEKSAMGRTEVFDQMLGMNMHLTPSAVMDAASKKLQFKVEDYLGTEGVAYVTEHLPEAMRTGKFDQFVAGFKTATEKHVNDLWEKSIANLSGTIENQVIAGGPQAWHQTMGDVNLMWMDGELEHAMRMTNATDAVMSAKKAGDWKRVNALWDGIESDGMKHFALYEKRTNAVYDGLEAGWKHLAADAKARGLNFNIPPLTEVRKSFAETRKMWREFFEYRQKTLRTFFENPKASEKAFDQIQFELGEKYKGVYEQEAKIASRADEAIAAHIEDPVQQQAFRSYRQQIADVTRKMREDVVAHRENILAAPAEERPALWQVFWAEKQADLKKIKYLDAVGTGVMQKDAEAMRLMGGNIRAEAADMAEGSPFAYLKQNNITINKKEFPDIFGGKLGVDKQGVPPALFSDKGLGIDEIGVRLTEGGFMTPDQATDANYIRDFLRRMVGQNQQDAFEKILSREIPNISDQFIADVKKVVPDNFPLELITEQAVYGRTNTAMDAMLEAGYAQMEKKAAFLKDLPQDVQDAVYKAVQQTKDGFSESNMAAIKFAEFRRDSALLNYNRRTNFDASVGNVFPFVFWTTGSMMKWAIHSIDRPAMLTTYLRMKKFLETAGAPESGFPSRFKDNIRVNLPFAPEWMGRQFVNPLNFLLPFDAFAQPYERWQKATQTAEGRADRLMQEQVQSGQLTQTEYEHAINTKTGDVWESALAQVKENDESMRFDAWDFANAVSSPHAPLQWAYLAATGRADEIGPLTPMTRILRNAFTVMGVKDYNNSQYNIEAKVRRTLGLSSYDKWDTYRVQREMSNLASGGKYSVEEVKRGMILADQEAAGQVTHEMAMQNPLYAEAVEKSNQEYTGGVAGFALGLLGIKVNSYPEGEQHLRLLSDQFGAAYKADNEADAKFDDFAAKHPEWSDEEALMAFEKQYPKDFENTKAIGAFFEAHPEYEARLGLFDKPEIRLQKFMVDEVWNTWNELPKVTRDELQDQLGQQFTTQFLDRDTRATDSISSEQLSVWLKLMGGDTPMIMTADQNMLISLFQGQLKLTAPETAWRAQVFYDSRKAMFGDYYKLQNDYYALPSAQRKAYLAKNPALKQYWDWRRDFMTKNPDLVPYLTDDPKAIAKAQATKRNPNLTGAVPTQQELARNMTPELQGLLSVSDEMTDDMEFMLLRVGINYGLTAEQVWRIMGG